MNQINYHLYMRSGCSLCEAMLHELGELSEQLLEQTDIRDVDARPEWQQLYGLLVPVLTTAKGAEICHYFLDSEKLHTSIPSS